MKRSTELEICTDQVEQCAPKLVGTMWILIRYYHLWEIVQSQDIVNKNLGIFHGCDSFLHLVRYTIFFNF